MRGFSVCTLRGKVAVFSVIYISVMACLNVAEALKPSGEAVAVAVRKGVCGPKDPPETGLQGQVPAALRASGFKGFNCNLELIGQVKGDGANWQTAAFTEGAHRTCAYHGTAFTT